MITKEEKYKFDKKSQELIKPILRGRDIERYFISFNSLYIILAKIGIEIEKYPDIKKHLEKFKNSLLKRTDFKPKIMKWWNLRPCDYYDEFEKEKIMYPDISQDTGFCLDNEGFFLNDSGHILVGGNKTWLAILNSSLMRFYLKNIVYSLGESGRRLKQIFIKEIPIKIPDKKQGQKIVELVDRMIELHKKKDSEQQIKNTDYEIDQEVYKLYGITPEEQKIIEESLK